jgi:transglutaminase-like putative cysteine protease
MKNLTMIRAIALAIAILFVSDLAIAQKAPIKYGKVSMDELLMKTYEKDTSAVAVYLCDYGVSEIPFMTTTFSFEYKHTRIMRIKILKDEGLDYGDLEFSFYKNGSNVGSVKGCTYNLENGKIVKTKISAKDRILEKSSDDLYTYKLACENVKPGSVVEFMYTISSGIPSTLGPWYFQHNIPTLWSEFRVNVPEYLHYKKNGKGYLTFDVNDHTYGNGSIAPQEQFSIDRYRFAVKDAPAFKKEPYTTSSKNYMSAVEFELAGIQEIRGPYHDKTGNWNQINKDLMDHQYFGIQLKSGGFLKDVVAEISAKAETDEEKILAAFNYIKSNMSWNDYYGKYVTSSLRAAFKEKKGNVADINLMLVVLLNKLGVKADPVILSTRSNGMLSLFSPSKAKFNYVIASCKIGENRIYLDATDENCPCNLLPERCINDKGRVISSAGSYFVDIKSKSISRSATIAKLNLTEDGVVSGNVDLSLNGFTALQFRDAIQDKSEEDLLETMDEAYELIDVESVDLENLRDVEKSVISKMEVEMTEELENVNDLIYFNPFVVNKIDENPFTLEERKYPVDFTYPIDRTFMLELTVPEGYTLESKPTPARINLPEKSGQFMYSASQNGNKIMVVSRFKINKRTFLFNEYASLKEFYNLVVAKHAEMLVLKKI